MGNLVASLIAAESLVTTEAKAKALRPMVPRSCVTKAKKAHADQERSIHQHRQVVALDPGQGHGVKKLFDPRSAPATWSGPGGYTRILKLGPRHGRQRPDGAHRIRLSFGPLSELRTDPLRG